MAKGRFGEFTGPLLGLSSPLAVANMALVGAGLFDMYVAGQAGVAEQAAVGIGLTVGTIAVMFFVGLTNAIVPLVSQHLGAGRGDECGHVLVQGLFLCVLTGGFLAVCGALTPLARPFADAVAAPDVGHLLTSYLAIRLCASPFFLIVLALGKFFIGIQKTHLNAVVLLTVSGMQCVLSYALCLGRFGLPELGSDGIALSYLIAQATGAVVGLLVCLLGPGRSTHPIRLRQGLARRDLRRKLVSLGMPLGFSQLFSNGSYLVLSILAVQFGPQAAAVYAVVNQTLLVPQRGFEIVGSAGSSLVGNYVGAERPNQAVRQHWATVGVTSMIGAAVALALWLFDDQLAGLLSESTAVAATAADVFLIAAVTMVPRAAMTVAFATLSAAGDVRVPSTLMIGARWVILVPATLLFAFLLDGGVVGIWLAESLSVVVVAVALTLRSRRSGLFEKSLVEPAGAAR
jgi:MATE family multidrug resistance protein